MAAECNVTSIVELTGLGRALEIIDKAADGTTPTAATYNYRVLAVAGTEEALDLGDVAVETVLVIRAIDYDLKVDLNYTAATFRTSFTIKAGEPAAVIPNPGGSIYVVDDAGDKTPKYEYLLCGTT